LAKKTHSIIKVALKPKSWKKIMEKKYKIEYKEPSKSTRGVVCFHPSVRTGARTTPSYARTKAENDTITSTLSTRGNKKKDHVLPVITNRVVARITPLGRRRTSCPLKERSSQAVLKTPGACSSHTSNVEISKEVVPANVEDKHCE
jgi:hypothetical protein